MNVRIWFEPSLFRRGRKGAPNHIRVGTLRHPVNVENGVPWSVADIRSPISAALRTAIQQVTCIMTVHDPSQMRKILRGRYVHGRFEATVRLVALNDGRSYLEVSASSPAVGLLKSSLDAILSGNDMPVEEYGRDPLYEAPVQVN